MQLPFVIRVLDPGAPDPRRLVRAWWLWVVGLGVVGLAIALTLWSPWTVRTPGAGAILEVSSTPGAASIDIDGRGSGATPTRIEIPAGNRRVTLRHDGYFDATYFIHVDQGQTATVHADLWTRSPGVQRLRPPFPGARITGASFIADGRVALAIGLPSGDERQLWLVDGDGGLVRVGPSEARGSVAVAQDGKRVAYLAASQGSALSSGRLDQVWIAGAAGGRGDLRYALSTKSQDERLLDLSWSPDGTHLLLASRQQIAGGAVRTRLRWLFVDGGDPKDLASLPSEIAAGSYTWSPGGDQVAFLAQVGQATSLCILVLATTEFRYLADLGSGDSSPIPFVPVSWSPDGKRLAYTAPPQEKSGGPVWGFGSKAPPILFLVDAARTPGQPIGQEEAQWPAWSVGGGLLTLARASGDGSLLLRQSDSQGMARDLGELFLGSSSAFAARWDLAHAQMLVASKGSSPGSPPDYRLVRFMPGAAK